MLQLLNLAFKDREYSTPPGVCKPTYYSHEQLKKLDLDTFEIHPGDMLQLSDEYRYIGTVIAGFDESGTKVKFYEAYNDNGNLIIPLEATRSFDDFLNTFNDISKKYMIFEVQLTKHDAWVKSTFGKFTYDDLVFTLPEFLGEVTSVNISRKGMLGELEVNLHQTPLPTVKYIEKYLKHPRNSEIHVLVGKKYAHSKLEEALNKYVLEKSIEEKRDGITVIYLQGSRESVLEFTQNCSQLGLQQRENEEFCELGWLTPRESVYGQAFYRNKLELTLVQEGLTIPPMFGKDDGFGYCMFYPFRVNSDSDDENDD